LILIFEIVAGIVLGVVFSSLGPPHCLGAGLERVGEVIGRSIGGCTDLGRFERVLPDVRKRSSASLTTSATTQPLETRAHFAARYKKAHPDKVNIPDDELVKEVLEAYPEWCGKVEGGCP